MERHSSTTSAICLFVTGALASIVVSAPCSTAAGRDPRDDGKPGSWEQRVLQSQPLSPSNAPGQGGAIGDEELKRHATPPARGPTMPPTFAIPSFVIRGDIVRGLQLSQAADPGAYVYGSSMKVYLQLTNTSDSDVDTPEMAARTDEAESPSDVLGRVRALQFRFAFDDGDEIVVPNAFIESKESRPPDPPLHLQPRAQLTAPFGIDGLVGSSGRLFDKIRSAGSMTITAEVSGLGLFSNPVTLPIATP